MSRHGILSENSAQICFVVPKELKAQLQKLAAAEDRSLSNFIARELAQLVRDKTAKTEPKREKK